MFHRRALKTAERIKLNPLFYSKQRLIKDNQSILKKEMSSTVGFYMPPVSYFGEGALDEVAEYIKNQDYKRPVIITDPGISKIGLAQRVTKLLEKRDRVVGIYDQTQPNPTTSNVNAGLMVLKEHNGDIIISIGGGSAHDNAKAIALLATNGGEIGDYEGVNKSKKKHYQWLLSILLLVLLLK